MPGTDVGARRLEAVSADALADCASEPIRVPGAIQPHGYLIAFDSDHVAQHVSENVFELVGRSQLDVVGQALAKWLAPGDVAALEHGLSAVELVDSDAPFRWAVHGALFDCKMHRTAALSVLELEPATESLVVSEPILSRALRRLQSAVGLQTLHEVAVREVRALTGCDRVVIYAFGAQGHGRVLAEARADDAASFLGLHFPASDIPAQARELYRLNWLRMIPDVDYTPVRIVTTPRAAAPLDLTFSTLRSVSPVHCEYMRHMGAGSSMSISLLRDRELWGLISCVHRAPRLISAEIRTACLSIGRLLSLQISALESAHESTLIAANEGLLAPIVEHLQRSPGEVLEGLASAPAHLLPLVGAGGVAILVGGTIGLFGACPSEPEVRALAVWVADQILASGRFSTSTLPLQYRPAQDFAQVASGVLAITLPKPQLSMVLWFRPEVTETVTWAGDPNKSPVLVPGTTTLRLSPRHSFEDWTTLSRHHAVAWGEHQIQAARDLRRSLIERDLTDQVRREQRAVAARDELVAVVSHDLRTPLSVVALQASMLIRTLVAETTAAPLQRVVAAATVIERATHRMSGMLRDLLDLSTIEQGRYSVHLEPLRVDQILDDSQALLGALAESKGVTLTFHSTPGLVVSADGERLHQVISNLVDNALKFTPSGGTVSVSAQADTAGGSDHIHFAVADTGPGIAPEHLAHVFERHWHVQDANPSGLGLGLYIARGIVAAHGGTIWAAHVAGAGCTVCFTLRCVQN